MNTHFEKALNHWAEIQSSSLDFGREAIIAIRDEHKTIRDFSIALCGDESLEDRIGRYIMAARFADSLDSHIYEMVNDYLTTAHYTELDKIERKYDRETALDIMQECLTEQPDESVLVKPVERLRAKRGGDETSTDELVHRFWMRGAKLLGEMQGELSRKGLLATKEDRRMVRLLSMVVRVFQARAKPTIRNVAENLDTEKQRA